MPHISIGGKLVQLKHYLTGTSFRHGWMFTSMGWLWKTRLSILLLLDIALLLYESLWYWVFCYTSWGVRHHYIALPSTQWLIVCFELFSYHIWHILDNIELCLFIDSSQNWILFINSKVCGEILVVSWYKMLTVPSRVKWFSWIWHHLPHGLWQKYDIRI